MLSRGSAAGFVARTTRSPRGRCGCRWDDVLLRARGVYGGYFGAGSGVMMAVLGSTVGGYVGSRVGRRLNPTALRALIVGVGVVAAGAMPQ